VGFLFQHHLQSKVKPLPLSVDKASSSEALFSPSIEVHFGSENNFVHKKVLGPKNFLVQTFFLSQISIEPKKEFWIRKKIWVKNKILGPKKNVLSEKF